MPRALDPEDLFEGDAELSDAPEVNPKLALAMYGVREQLPRAPLMRRCFHTIVAMFQAAHNTDYYITKYQGKPMEHLSGLLQNMTIGLRRLEFEEEQEASVSTAVDAEAAQRALRAKKAVLRIASAANRSSWCSCCELSSFVLTGGHCRKTHRPIQVFLSRAMYLFEQCRRLLQRSHLQLIEVPDCEDEDKRPLDMIYFQPRGNAAAGASADRHGMDSADTTTLNDCFWTRYDRVDCERRRSFQIASPCPAPPDDCSTTFTAFLQQLESRIGLCFWFKAECLRVPLRLGREVEQHELCENMLDDGNSLLLDSIVNGADFLHFQSLVHWITDSNEENGRTVVSGFTHDQWQDVLACARLASGGDDRGDSDVEIEDTERFQDNEVQDGALEMLQPEEEPEYADDGAAEKHAASEDPALADEHVLSDDENQQETVTFQETTSPHDDWLHRGPYLFELDFYTYITFVMRKPRAMHVKVADVQRVEDIFFFDAHYALAASYVQVLKTHGDCTVPVLEALKCPAPDVNNGEDNAVFKSLIGTLLRCPGRGRCADPLICKCGFFRVTVPESEIQTDPDVGYMRSTGKTLAITRLTCSDAVPAEFSCRLQWKARRAEIEILAAQAQSLTDKAKRIPVLADVTLLRACCIPVKPSAANPAPQPPNAPDSQLLACTTQLWIQKTGRAYPECARRVLACLGFVLHHDHQMSLAQFAAQHLREAILNLDMLSIARTTKLTTGEQKKDKVEDEDVEAPREAPRNMETEFFGGEIDGRNASEAGSGSTAPAGGQG